MNHNTHWVQLESSAASNTQ